MNYLRDDYDMCTSLSIPQSRLDTVYSENRYSSKGHKRTSWVISGLMVHYLTFCNNCWYCQWLIWNHQKLLSNVTLLYKKLRAFPRRLIPVSQSQTPQVTRHRRLFVDPYEFTHPHNGWVVNYPSIAKKKNIYSMRNVQDRNSFYAIFVRPL